MQNVPVSSWPLTHISLSIVASVGLSGVEPMPHSPLHEPVNGHRPHTPLPAEGMLTVMNRSANSCQCGSVSSSKKRKEYYG